MSEQNPFSNEPIRPPDQPGGRPRMEPVVSLDYSHGREPVEERRIPMSRGVALGCLGYIVVSVAWFVMSYRLFRSNQISWGGWAAVTVCLLALSLWARLRFRVAGFGYGILLALVLTFVGVPLLILGFCFFAAK